MDFFVLKIFRVIYSMYFTEINDLRTWS